MSVRRPKWPDTLIGARLREARLAKQLQLKTVAQQLYVSRDVVQDVESGYTQLTAYRLKQFAKLYDKPLEFFLQDV